MLVKRHGSVVHAKTADEFALFVLALICIYSLVSSLSSRYKPLRTIDKLLKSSYFLTPLWFSLCLFGILYDLHFSLIQFARRCGQLSIACCTIATFLGLKPALLPRTYQVGLMPLHKWIGRSGIVFAYAHGVIYFVKLAAAHNVSKRHAGHQKLSNHLNIMGIIAMILLGVIFIVSLRPLRQRMYTVFYILHWPLVLSMFIMMIWHARPSSTLLIGCALTFFCLQFILRLIFTHGVKITKVEPYGVNSDLKLVEFEPGVTGLRDVELATHVRLSLPLTHWRAWLNPSHPYTLIGNNKLVVKQTRFQINEGAHMAIFGYFPSSFDYDLYDNLIVIGGGSGVSVMPNFVALEKQGKRVKYVWITRDADNSRVLEPLGISNCDVYITGDENENLDNPDAFELQDYQVDDDGDETNGDHDDTDSALLNSKGKGKSTDGNSNGIKKHSGRPDFGSATREFLENVPQPESTCVVCCGPQELVTAVEKWAKVRNLESWAEVYGF